MGHKPAKFGADLFYRNIYIFLLLGFQSPTKQVAFADEANITTTARQQSDTQMPPVKKRKIIDVSAGDTQLN